MAKTVNRSKSSAAAAGTEAILRHWREAVPNDRLAHLVKDGTRALLRALQQPEVKAQCEKLGLYATGSTPKAFGSLIQATIEQMRETARSANISLDA